MASPVASTIVWLRDDLRLDDNPALAHAVEIGLPLTVVYVLDEESAGVRPLGGAAKWWLHHSLASLRAALTDAGSTLILRRGPAGPVIRGLAEETGAKHLLWNRRYGGPERAVDAEIKAWAAENGIEAASFQANLLFEPWTITTGSGGPYKVFTPFWRACTASGEPRQPLDAPPSLPSPAGLAATGSDTGPRQVGEVTPWQTGPCCPCPRTGAAAWRGPGNPVRPGPTAAWTISWTDRWRTTAPAGTCPEWKAPAGCPRTCASAKSARSGSGTRSASAFPANATARRRNLPVRAWLAGILLAAALRQPAAGHPQLPPRV